jgi:hypothetical protein
MTTQLKNRTFAVDLINDGTAPNSGAIAASSYGGLSPSDTIIRQAQNFNELEFRNGSDVSLKITLNGNPKETYYAGTNEGFEIKKSDGKRFNHLRIQNLSTTYAAAANTIRCTMRKVI